MSYGIGPHGHGQGHHLGSGHPHQTHPHVQHAPQHQQPQPPPGRGLPLSAVPPTSKLFIVEFKAGRTDLFYLTDADKAEIMRIEAGYAATQSQNHTNGDGNAHASFEGAEGTDYPIKVGDLVIVEADRGRDLGRVVNDNITVEEVEAWLDAGRSASGQLLDLSQQSNQQWGDSPMPTPISPTGVYAGIPPPSNPNSISSGSGGGSGSKKEINPKQIYGKAGPAEASLLAAKMGDEMKALQLCQSKVRAKKLPMEVVDAEYQWDRRKLTFYFVADKRIDFRELVRELFRLYKTRIWMASLQGGGGFEQ
ncbi:PSP1 C-terminal conserved region-domain-containing protein [Lentinula aciculospora]|uniref:PSP1 C-terminal conserved region-domain-containing protein n=1 Tax=Lentinula aciculospora TaxID=153920 RepID=A0A9W9DTZ6_9AGAR|nr:PSP1 C-terminal conserved region-domain-containing protein [Lentinula aciculospora]